MFLTKAFVVDPFLRCPSPVSCCFPCSPLSRPSTADDTSEEWVAGGAAGGGDWIEGVAGVSRTGSSASMRPGFSTRWSRRRSARCLHTRSLSRQGESSGDSSTNTDPQCTNPVDGWIDLSVRVRRLGMVIMLNGRE